jgi:DNA end-binding protein Ku
MHGTQLSSRDQAVTSAAGSGTGTARRARRWNAGMARRSSKRTRRTRPGRAYWSGQIRLSLVTIPVDLYAATTSAATISFHQIHGPSGKRIRYQKVVPGLGPVDADEILKGYEYEKGRYVVLTDEELDEIKLESKKTLELTQFVDACEIDPIYFDRPYFTVPADDLAEDAYRVLRDALRREKKVALGQLAIRGREYIVAVKPCHNGLLVETLRFEEEIRKSSAFFEDISSKPAEQDALELAEEIIARKTAKFDPTAFTDHYATALHELVERKLKARGGKIVEEAPHEARPQGENVIDLMSALKRSLEKPGASPSRKPAAPKRRRAAAVAAKRRKSA